VVYGEDDKVLPVTRLPWRTRRQNAIGAYSTFSRVNE